MQKSLKRSSNGGGGGKKRRKKRRRSTSTVSSTSLTAGWQRLNDLPNNKSSGRYDRMQRGPSLGTSEPLTSSYLSAKASSTSSFSFWGHESQFYSFSSETHWIFGTAIINACRPPLGCAPYAFVSFDL